MVRWKSVWETPSVTPKGVANPESCAYPKTPKARDAMNSDRLRVFVEAAVFIETGCILAPSLVTQLSTPETVACSSNKVVGLNRRRWYGSRTNGHYPYMRRLFSVVAMMAMLAGIAPARSESLKGNVEKSDTLKRIARPKEARLSDSLVVRALGARRLQAVVSTDSTEPLNGYALTEGDFRLDLYRDDPKMAPLNRQLPMRQRPLYWRETVRTPRLVMPDLGCCGYGWDLPMPYIEMDSTSLMHRMGGQISYNSASGQLMPSDFQSPQWPSFPGAPPLLANRNFIQAQPVAVQEESLINWQSWYEQVARAIYQAWSGETKGGGSAEVRVEVTRDRKISATTLSATAKSPSFNRSLLKAINAVNGSAVLAFPPNSRRRAVSFEANFTTAASNQSGVSVAATSDSERVPSR